MIILMTSILFVLGGCNNDVVKEKDLIGGKWVGVAGYENMEIEGEPLCPPFDKGIEFIDEETVYVEDEDREYSYDLRESEDGMKIELNQSDGNINIYKIFIEGDNGIGLIGSGIQKKENCYFEREK